MAQWSRNIERPAFPALNPARIRISDYSWQSGNPSLRPTYIHRFSLTAVWKYRYTLTVGGNLHHDLIREIAHRDATAPDAVYIRPENHYTENHWFVAASVPAKITRWWNLSVNAVGVMQRIRLNSTDSPATHYLMFADATCSFTLPAGFFAEAAYRAQSRLYSGNSEVGPRHTLSATVKKQLFDKRLTLFLHPVEHHRLRLGVRLPDRRHAAHDRHTASLVGALVESRRGLEFPHRQKIPRPHRRKCSGNPAQAPREKHGTIKNNS